MRPGKPARNRRKDGKYRVCDERFYFYWVPGPIELIFPDWFCFVNRWPKESLPGMPLATGRLAGLHAGDAGD
jgi:hypothetical protein